MGVFLRFEDDSVESAKQVMQWNVKIINVSEMYCLYSLEEFGSIKGLWIRYCESILTFVICGCTGDVDRAFDLTKV